MTTKLPRFYPIFDSADWLRRALPLGVQLVQIRIKDMPPPLLMGELALCQELCREHGATLVVNDHWRAAIDLGCDFVHLGQEDLDDADIPALRRAGIRLGVSTHDHAELDRALDLQSVLVGINNRNLNTFNVTLETTRTLVPRIPADRLPVCESGLFTPTDLADMARCGARTFLIGESLMRQADVAAATRALLADPVEA